MRRLAFLSMDSLDEFVFDDDLALDPLRELGWETDTVSWKSGADWSEYEAVVIRTPWDYQDAPDDFTQVLSDIEAVTRLENPLSIVRWNLPKTYLREMEGLGAPIVPTLWGECVTPDQIEKHVSDLSAEEFIIKPVISANADNTYRLTQASFLDVHDELREVYSDRAYMVQPFLQNVISEGEFSLFYFNGEYSHTILKTPETGDFRVQEEHGGIIQSVEPETALLEAGRRAVANLPDLLYARADFVRENDQFLLMELELIEPALYFRTDAPHAAARFAKAFDERMKQPVIA